MSATPFLHAAASVTILHVKLDLPKGIAMAEIATIPELILSSCERPELAGKTALSVAATTEPLEALTYSELARIARAAGRELRRRGLSPGERVALMCESRPIWGAAYLGVLAGGGACVPIDPGAREAEVKEILGHSGARLLICSDRVEAVARDAADELSRETVILRIEKMPWASEDGAGDDPVFAGDPGAEAVVIYTSGTTGRPKAVRLSHRNIVSNLISVKEAIQVAGGDVFLSVLPLNHTFECTPGLLVPLSVGASIAYSPSLRPRDLRDALLMTRPTVMLGVPLLYEKMLNGLHRAVRRAPLFQRAAGLVLIAAGGAARRALGRAAARAVTGRIRKRAGLDRVRLLVSGAAAMPPFVYSDFESLGVTIVQGYGLTEASPVVAVNPPDGPRADTVGFPLPGIEIGIDSPDDNGVGEIMVKGDNVMMGYLRDDDATAEVLHDGWLKTGDLGRIDPDGHLRLTGRRKNVIVTSAGKNVYPEEVEQRLLGSRHVCEVIVVGRSPGVGRGEQPWAVVFPTGRRSARISGSIP